VEHAARTQGAEECYVAIAPDLDADRRFLRLSGARPLGRRFAIRLSLAYKGVWVRRAKTFAWDEKDRTSIARADTWFADFAAISDPNGSLGDQVAVALAGLSGARLIDWMVEGPVGTRPLAVLASSNGASETPAQMPTTVMSIGMAIDGVPWCGAGLAGAAAEHPS
jgi:hypothetical protein